MTLSQRQTFIASHAPDDTYTDRNGSSSPGLDQDEADEVPYSQTHSIEEQPLSSPARPPPGGSFPSETNLQAEEMYGRSRTESDATHPDPHRLSLEEPAFRPVTSDTHDSIGEDAHLMATALATAVLAAKTQSEIQSQDPLNNTNTKADQSPHSSTMDLPTQDTSSDIVSGNLAYSAPNTTAPLAIVPKSGLQRSKSRREIVEEVIAQAAGNHPERNTLPGVWPGTPVKDIPGPK